jgi:hypothetical protein
MGYIHNDDNNSNESKKIKFIFRDLKSYLILYMSLYLGAEIAQLVSRRATGWTAGVRFPVLARNVSLLHSVQTGSGPEGDHSPPSSAEIKNGGATPPILHMSSWRSA